MESFTITQNTKPPYIQGSGNRSSLDNRPRSLNRPKKRLSKLQEVSPESIARIDKLLVDVTAANLKSPPESFHV